MEKKRRVIILGGGFGGAYCAQALEKSDVRNNIDIILIDRRNYFIFYPLLVEAGTGSIESRHAVVSIRSFVKKTRFLMADVTAVNAEKNQITYQIEGGFGPQTLDYDQLVLSLGSVTMLPNVPGLREFGFQMKSLRSALRLRDRAIQLLEIADATTDIERRRALLHFVVVGANFTGVEVAGEFNSFLREAVKRYPNLTTDDYKITLVELGDHILGALSDDDLSDYTLRYMRSQGISVLLKTSATEISLEKVVLSNGDMLDTHTVIWCAGIAPNPLINKFGLPADRRGYIVCDRDLRVTGHKNVWAIGDCAVNLDANNKPYPATAQLAVKQGKHVAKNIALVLRGKTVEPCDIKQLGAIASIGRGTGVGKVMGMKFSGYLASVLYHVVYLMKMPGFGRKLRVALDWILDVFFSRDFVEMGFYRKLVRPEPTKAPAARPSAEAVTK
jgi:NADH dehydrogenase